MNFTKKKDIPKLITPGRQIASQNVIDSCYSIVWNSSSSSFTWLLDFDSSYSILSSKSIRISYFVGSGVNKVSIRIKANKKIAVKTNIIK